MDQANSKDDKVTFVADAMLGRLARWLRILGFDTLYDPSASDHRLAALARAEGRMLLTRDRELARRKGIRVLLIHSQTLEEQLKQVLTAVGTPSPDTLPRCPQCNSTLTEVTAEQAREHVPAYVARTHRQFRHCPRCDRYYWPGTHLENVKETLTRTMDTST